MKIKNTNQALRFCLILFLVAFCSKQMIATVTVKLPKDPTDLTSKNYNELQKAAEAGTLNSDDKTEITKLISLTTNKKLQTKLQDYIQLNDQSTFNNLITDALDEIKNAKTDTDVDDAVNSLAAYTSSHAADDKMLDMEDKAKEKKDELSNKGTRKKSDLDKSLAKLDVLNTHIKSLNTLHTKLAARDIIIAGLTDPFKTDIDDLEVTINTVDYKHADLTIQVKKVFDDITQEINDIKALKKSKEVEAKIAGSFCTDREKTIKDLIDGAATLWDKIALHSVTENDKLRLELATILGARETAKDAAKIESDFGKFKAMVTVVNDQNEATRIEAAAKDIKDKTIVINTAIGTNLNNLHDEVVKIPKIADVANFTQDTQLQAVDKNLVDATPFNTAATMIGGKDLVAWAKEAKDEADLLATENMAVTTFHAIPQVKTDIENDKTTSEARMKKTAEEARISSHTVHIAKEVLGEKGVPGVSLSTKVHKQIEDVETGHKALETRVEHLEGRLLLYGIRINLRNAQSAIVTVGDTTEKEISDMFTALLKSTYLEKTKVIGVSTLIGVGGGAVTNAQAYEAFKLAFGGTYLEGNLPQIKTIFSPGSIMTANTTDVLIKNALNQLVMTLALPY